jgi:hypothetical protein
MDDNDFFKQATLLICSSLQIDTALHRCFNFISQSIPSDWITLNIFDPAVGGLRYIATADAKEERKMEKIIKLPEQLIRDIESGNRLNLLHDQKILNRPAQDATVSIIISEFKLPEISLIAQAMFIDLPPEKCTTFKS